MLEHGSTMCHAAQSRSRQGGDASKARSKIEEQRLDVRQADSVHSERIREWLTKVRLINENQMALRCLSMGGDRWQKAMECASTFSPCLIPRPQGPRLEIPSRHGDDYDMKSTSDRRGARKGTLRVKQAHDVKIKHCDIRLISGTVKSERGRQHYVDAGRNT